MSKRKEHTIHIATTYIKLKPDGTTKVHQFSSHYSIQSAKELTFFFFCFYHILYNTEIQLLPHPPKYLSGRNGEKITENEIIPVAVKQYSDAYVTCHIIPIYFWPFFHSTPIFFNMFTFFFLGESSSMSSE
jgi:hypothetical protein